ncbi:pro-resilin [Hordeum vulgare]|nr:pro-resilin [Hordeum vulgare]
MAAAEEGVQPLMYQVRILQDIIIFVCLTVALKVSIHCEGCKKKVKKVLQTIEGVYKTDIDTQQHKVVVVGNVSVDALVKKLIKTGKHAEPWPEPLPPPSDANSPAGCGGGSGGGGGGGGGGKKKKKKKNKNKPTEPAPPGAATAEGGGGSVPPENHDHEGTCDEASGDEQPHQDQVEGGGGGGGDPPKNPGAGDPHDGRAAFAMTPHGMQPMPPSANASGGGGGGKKKKKGKGGSNGNANGGDGAGATAQMNPHDAPANPVTGNDGRNAPAVVDAGAYPPATAMSYPGYYGGGAGAGHMPYAMSYSTSHPHRSSAYYHPMAGAAYTGGAGYYYSTAPVSAAPGSYYMFSEENANACSVM